LPDELHEAIESPLPSMRAVAVQELGRLLTGTHAGLSLAARIALQQLADDDSRTVANSAADALEAAPGDPSEFTTVPAALPALPQPPVSAPSRPVTAAAGPPPSPRRRPTRRQTVVAGVLAGLVAAAAITFALLNRGPASDSGSDRDELMRGIPTSIAETCGQMTKDADGLSTVSCRRGVSYTLASSEISAIETVGDATGADECRSSPDYGDKEITRYALKGHTGTLRCSTDDGKTYEFLWHDDTTPLVMGRFHLEAFFETGLRLWQGLVVAG